jgi:hypothetical protein
MAQCSVCKSETELFDRGVSICPSCDNKKQSRSERMARYERESEIEERPSEPRIEDPTEKGLIARYGLLFVIIGAFLASAFAIDWSVRKIQNAAAAVAAQLRALRGWTARVIRPDFR